MADDKKPVHGFSLGAVRFGTLINGQFVEQALEETRTIEPEYLGEVTDVGKDHFTIGSFSLHSNQLDEDLKSLLMPALANPALFRIDFITRRVKLRRTILFYMGKPEHIKCLKSIVRLPRVTIEQYKDEKRSISPQRFIEMYQSKWIETDEPSTN